jgi:hypothetical protein
MKIDSKKILYYIIFTHLFLWTVIPSILNENLPLDTIEGLAWGNELKLGYDKYPPIFPLFTELFFKFFGNQDWVFYLLSQLFVVSCFLVLFNFSKYFLKNETQRLVSVLLLECVYFFNYTTPELNAFIPLFLFLPITALFCWRAIIFDKKLDWIMFGVFAGISSLTYYLALYFLASLGIFFIREIIKKKYLNYKYFLAIISYLIILTPHLYFILANDFKSIQYAFFRSFGDPLSGISQLRLMDHIFYPMIFIFKQLVILTPLLLLTRVIISHFKIKIDYKDEKLIFLFAITFLPIILMFLTSLVGGVRVRTMWMTTFYVFPGLFFVYLFSSSIILKKFKKFFIIFLFIFLMLPTAYGIDSHVQKDKRTDFPGKKVAKKIQTVWDKNYSNKVGFVVGPGWVYGGWYAGNLSYHLKDRPKLRYELKENLKNTGIIRVGIIDSIKFCEGTLLKIEPYFDTCLIGKK